MNELHPLLSANHLTEIPTSDKPPRLGGKIHMITPLEFGKQFACKYTETILGREKDIKAVVERWRTDAKVNGIELEASKNFTAKVLHRLQNPFTDFVISKISDKVGWGVFATKDIPRNTTIALYSGEMVPYKKHEAYSFGMENSLDIECLTSVSSLKYGGIARFFQHLPKDGEKRRKDILSRLLDIDYNFREQMAIGNPCPREFIAFTIDQKKSDLESLAKERAKNEYDLELNDCVFNNPEARSQVAVRNVHIKKRIVKGQPLLVLVTLYSIQKGEQLGLSYGKDYWQGAGRFPEFFDIQGNVMSHSLYKRKWVQLFFKNPLNKRFYLSPRLEFTPNTNLQSTISKMPYLSPYQARRCFIKANVIGAEKLSPIQPTTFALYLIEVLKSKGIKASVETFFRSFHLNPNDKDTFIVDTVCKLKGSNKSQDWKKLTELLMPIKNYVKFCPHIQEVIFEGTNVKTKVFQDFIYSK